METSEESQVWESIQIEKSSNSSKESSSCSDNDTSDDEETLLSHQHHPVSTPSSSRLRYIPLLIPFFGLSTICITISWSCFSRFDCTQHYPTLSYAATFHPQGYLFMIGMCLTATCIQSTILLLAAQMFRNNIHSSRQRNLLMVSILGWGTVTAAGLFTLATCGMKYHHDIHVTATIVFFISAWIMILLVHMSRRRTSSRTEGNIGRTDRGVWYIRIGLVASFLFAVMFCCVNGIVSNPLKFSAGQEAAAELTAIVCQLLFMGTLAHELGRRSHVSEPSEDQVELIRR